VVLFCLNIPLAGLGIDDKLSPGVNGGKSRCRHAMEENRRPRAVRRVWEEGLDEDREIVAWNS